MFIYQRDYTDYTVLLCRTWKLCHLFNLLILYLSTRLHGLYRFAVQDMKICAICLICWIFIYQRDCTEYTDLLCRTWNLCHLFNLLNFYLSTRLHGLYGFAVQDMKICAICLICWIFIYQRDYTDYTVLLCRTWNPCHLFNLLILYLSTGLHGVYRFAVQDMKNCVICLICWIFIYQRDYTDYTDLLCRTWKTVSSV